MDYGQIALIAVGAILMLVAAVGCFVPVLPGPLIAYAALWIPFAFGYPASFDRLAVGAVAVVAVVVVDYILPAVCAKKFSCSRWGMFGCIVGSVVGFFFLPIGIIVGPFVGTVVGELIAGKAFAESLRGGVGALLGFVVCLALKLVAVGLFAWWYFSDVLSHSSSLVAP
jgi:hypothetical protein